MTHRSAVLVAALLALPPSALGRDQQLLDQALARHAASLAAIRTMTAKVVMETAVLPGVKLPPEMMKRDALPDHRGQFQRSGQRVRVDELEGGLGKRTIIRDYGADRGLARPSGIGGGTKSGGTPPATTGSLMNSFSFLDISDYMFTIPPPYPLNCGSCVTLSELVSKSTRVAAKRDTLDGVETVRIDCATGEGDGFEVWLDVKANYMFRRVINRTHQMAVETRVLEFAEPQPGIYCPVRMERVLPKLTRSVFTITDLKVNVSVPDSAFDTNLPKGSRVFDRDENKVYEVGPNGRPDKLVGRVIEPAAPSGASAPIAATPLEADEPTWWSWPRVALIASVAVAVIGLVLRSRRIKRAA